MKVVPNSTAALLMPRIALSDCYVTAILRDTRQLNLSQSERYNRFPPSPLCVITLLFDGQVRTVVEEGEREVLGPTLPQITFSGPQTRAVVSRNEGPVRFLCFGIYPDAWKALSGATGDAHEDQTVPLRDVASGPLLCLCESFLTAGYSADSFAAFEDRLDGLWQEKRMFNPFVPARLSDWIMALAIRASQSGTAKGIRQFQRRIREWTGQSNRRLDQYSRNELLFEKFTIAKREGDASLAKLAAEAGFSDQSHMGRFVRQMHGQTPARLSELIDTHESYWCYRLLGTRF